MASIDFPEQRTAVAIREHYARTVDKAHRPHLGASLIAGPCERALWYTFHWCATKDVDGRLARLFETGHLAEPRMAENLRAIGVELYTEQPGGGQWTVKDIGGHFGGSMDGAGRGFPEAPKSWAVWECKTSGTKAFEELKAKGVKQAKPQHYGQMTIYMGYTRMHRAMYTVICKETDEIYTEWVHFDQVEFDRLVARAQRVIGAKEPPPRITKDPSFYKCRWCDFHSVCHLAKLPEVNCRTCAHSTPEMDGEARWSCARWKADVPVDHQRSGCGSHVYIPILLEGAGKAQAGHHNADGSTTVEYLGQLGRFDNGPDGLSSEELRRLEDPAAAPVAWEAKTKLVKAGFATTEVVK